MAAKRVAPPQWREDIDRWLEALKAAGYSDQTLRTRRYKMTQIAAGVGRSPLDVDGETLVSWMAAEHRVELLQMDAEDGTACRRPEP